MHYYVQQIDMYVQGSNGEFFASFYFHNCFWIVCVFFFEYSFKWQAVNILTIIFYFQTLQVCAQFPNRFVKCAPFTCFQEISNYFFFFIIFESSFSFKLSYFLMHRELCWGISDRIQNYIVCGWSFEGVSRSSWKS